MLNKNYIEALDIIFRRISPELLKDILLNTITSGKKEKVSVQFIDEAVFQRYALLGLDKKLTDNEIQSMYKLFFKKSHSVTSPYPENIWGILAETGNAILTEDGTRYKKEETSRWREVSLRLGQDLFTTSYLAFKDSGTSTNKRIHFSWNPVFEVDDDDFLQELINNPMAENHFHLYGSTSIFHLSWICMMNHPENCVILGKELEQNRFQDNLESDALFNYKDYQMSWADRLRLAAWIRVNLFLKFCGYTTESLSYNQLDDFLDSTGKQNHIVCGLTDFARNSLSQEFELSIGKRRSLDYAFLNSVELDSLSYNGKLFVESNNNLCRLFVGERFFLYNCFKMCFEERLSFQEQNLFYLYLLLKERLRSELVEVNKRPGFQNFSKYQRRKSMFYNQYWEYNAESIRLAINRNMKDNHINSLENRIMPSNDYHTLIKSMAQIDGEVIFAWEDDNGIDHDISNSIYTRKRMKNMLSKNDDKEYFFTIHFPKRSNKDISSKYTDFNIPLRNNQVRKSAHIQSINIARTLIANSYIQSRFRGIDACSLENDCRPETFATEYRFLRNLINPKNMEAINIGFTYHVGEDFDDLTTGIRAIDEAILFLEMQEGNRLGHAMAVGVIPGTYYKIKNDFQCIDKQNRLDDLVWLIFRSVEFEIIKTEKRKQLIRSMKKEAWELYKELYDSNSVDCNTDLELYFASWKFRGDHPKVYHVTNLEDLRKSVIVDIDESLPGGCLSLKNQYDFQMRRKSTAMMLSTLEKDQAEKILKLICQYHFDPQVRIKGRDTVTFSINPTYTKLLYDMQEVLMKQINDKKICIECNPSSNVLIGVFDSYEEHPIFRFIENGLNVSINTDDQGVFDTSLVNEYTLIHSAYKNKYRVGKAKANTFISTIRKNGESQIFPSIINRRS